MSLALAGGAQRKGYHCSGSAEEENDAIPLGTNLTVYFLSIKKCTYPGTLLGMCPAELGLGVHKNYL